MQLRQKQIFFSPSDLITYMDSRFASHMERWCLNDPNVFDMMDEEDEMLLIPIPEELELLEKAKLFLQEYSIRQVARWLSDNSGRYISHSGLYKRVRMEEKRRRASSNYKQYAKKYKEASRKSQNIEEKRLGGRSTRSLATDEDYIKLERGECCPFCGQTKGNI